MNRLTSTLTVSILIFAGSVQGEAPPDIQAREALAEAELKLNHNDRVVELLNPYTDVASPHGYITLSRAYAKKKDYASLVRILILLSEKSKDDYLVQFMLGDARLKLAQILKDEQAKRDMEAQAISDFRTVIRLKKNFLPAYDALTNYFIIRDANHEAREILSDLLKVTKRNARAYQDLCRLFAIDGYLSQAVQHCLRAIQYNKNVPDNYVYLAQAYFDQQEVTKAEKALIQAAQKFPNSEYVQYGAGSYYYQKKNYPVAAKYFKRAVASDQKSGRSQRGLANSLFELKEYVEAIPHFTAACEADKSYITDVLTAASRLRQIGEGPLASKYSSIKGMCQ